MASFSPLSPKQILQTPNGCFLHISQRLDTFASREEIITFVFNYFSGQTFSGRTFAEYTRVLLELWNPTLEEARNVMVCLSADFSAHLEDIKSLASEYLRVKEKALSDFLTTKRDSRSLEDIFSDPNDTSRLLTPLEISLLYDEAEMFHFFLQRGANPNVYNVFPPLVCAFRMMEHFDEDDFYLHHGGYTIESRTLCHQEMDKIDSYIRELLVAGADPEAGGLYDRQNYYPLQVALSYGHDSFFSTSMLEFQLGGVGNLDSLLKSYLENKACYPIAEHCLDSIWILVCCGMCYSSQDLTRTIASLGESFQEVTPALANYLDISRLLLEISPLEIEKLRAFVPLFLMQEYDESIGIEKILLPRAVKTIILHLTEACYRPEGPGFYAAMRRFNAFSASRCANPVSN